MLYVLFNATYVMKSGKARNSFLNVVAIKRILGERRENPLCSPCAAYHKPRLNDLPNHSIPSDILMKFSVSSTVALHLWHTHICFTIIGKRLSASSFPTATIVSAYAVICSFPNACSVLWISINCVQKSSILPSIVSLSC
jgi:hypothetical protein